jgi:hypothetical protein
MPAQAGLLPDGAAQVLPAQTDRHDRPALHRIGRRGVEIDGRLGRLEVDFAVNLGCTELDDLARIGDVL